MSCCDTDVVCYDHKKPMPITSITNNQTAVENGNVTYTCSFGANYEVIYINYWRIQIKDGRLIYVDHNNNSDIYKVDVPVQKCPADNSSCCNFVNKLHIFTSVMLDKAVVFCHVNAYSVDNQESSLLSELHMQCVFIVCMFRVLLRYDGTTHNLSEECMVPSIGFKTQMN